MIVWNEIERMVVLGIDQRIKLIHVSVVFNRTIFLPSTP